MDDQPVEGPGPAPPPTELGKNLRCCYGCRLLKSFGQFYEQGCENCPWMGFEGDKERVFEGTTTEFSGLISVVDPRGSWGAKWLHFKGFVPGCYALAISGEPPQNVEDTIIANRGRVMENIG